MKFRALPRSIPVYTLKDARRHVRNSMDDSELLEVIVYLWSAIVIVPAFLCCFIAHFVKCLWTVVRYCTYSLSEAEEAAVAMVLRNKATETTKPSNATT